LNEVVDGTEIDDQVDLCVAEVVPTLNRTSRSRHVFDSPG
jgi:hypothetical protein